MVTSVQPCCPQTCGVFWYLSQAITFSLLCGYDYIKLEKQSSSQLSNSLSGSGHYLICSPQAVFALVWQWNLSSQFWLVTKLRLHGDNTVNREGWYDAFRAVWMKGLPVSFHLSLSTWRQKNNQLLTVFPLLKWYSYLSRHTWPCGWYQWLPTYLCYHGYNYINVVISIKQLLPEQYMSLATVKFIKRM